MNLFIAKKTVIIGLLFLLMCLVSGNLTSAIAADGQVAITVTTTTGIVGTGGTVTRLPAGTLVSGTTYKWGNNTNVTFTIAPSVGYVISDVKWNNVSAGAVSSLTKNIRNNDNFTLVAIFKQVVSVSASYSSTPAGAPNGTFTPTGPFDVNTTQNFTVTSPANWIINTVKLDAVGGTDMTLSCNASKTSCAFSYGVGTTNHTFYVAMLPYDNPASVNAPTAAVTTTTVAVTNNITDPDGVQNVTYYLYSDAVGTLLVSSNSTGAFTGLADSTNFWIRTTAQTKNKTTDTWVDQQSALVNVTTSGPTYVLNLSIALGSGTVTANGIAVVPPVTTSIGKNQSVTYIFTPGSSPEYALSDVKINGVSQGPASPLTIPNVTSDKTIEVYFKRVWTIAVSTGANGAVSPANPAKVVDGGNQAFTMLPATGADILQVLVDNVDQGPISSYTFSNVTADHTIAATFVVSASDMNKYSVIPPFIVSAVKPNLLLMIDNSSSMYDVAYSTAATYCLDKSYSDASSYEGYFDQAATYSYNLVDNKFESGATLPGSCTYRSSYMCVDMVGTSPNRTVTKLIGSGKFFNWLTASKFDVQKKVLTGGKFNTTYNVLEGESRGCVGRRFIKTIPAVAGLTFGIRGPNSYDADFVNQSTQGGGTRIEIYDAAYNEAACLAAATAWVDPNSIGTVQNITKDCIGTGTSALKGDAYNHIIHNCFWALTGSHGLSNMNTLQGDCASIYDLAEYNNDPSKITKENGADAVCSSVLTHPDFGNGGGNTLGFLGRCATKSVAGNGNVSWNWDDTCSDTEIRDYCGGVHEFDVTDPSNAAVIATDTPVAVPSFIMDAGFNALGNVAGTFLVRIALSTQPTGLIQDYSKYISFGAMQFNQDGSGSECNDGTNNTTSNIKCAKSCSVTTTKQCYITADCPAGESCNLRTKIDGGKILAYNNFDPVGDHTSGLIKAIDDIQATSWTPWAEAYYNSIGYFANRTDLRLNATDFDATKNPSEVYCRLNNTLIISDGGSTADQNASVTSLAGVYNDGDGQTGACAGFSGSKNMDDMAWLAKNRNIKTFIKAGGSTETHDKNNEFVTTYTVFTGGSDATTGECNPGTLMSQTAINGGTTPYVADGGPAFRNAIDDAFTKIAASSASGTAASILSNSEGSGAALMQAVFYPKKDFDKDAADKGTSASWLGELQSFWYFLDPKLNKSSIREDTDGNFKLNMNSDKILSFQFDPVQKKTLVYRFLDTNGDGVADGPDAVDAGTGKQVSYDPDVIKSLWRAGRKLWERDLTTSRRTIFTSLDGTSLVKLSTAVADGELQKNATARTYLRVADEAGAEKLINYINGTDQTGFRKRTVSITGCGLASCSREWRLGDIISSTPKLVSPSKLNNYDLGPPNGYSDNTYKTFALTSSYATRGMAFVGANDGMLHAFRMGILKELPDRLEKAKLTYPDSNTIASSSSDLGMEEWAFAPRQVLPYLNYLSDPNYTHVYYVDRSPSIADSSIGKPSGCGSDYSECTKSGTTWRTVLISGMGIGGAVRDKTDTSCTTCIKTPIDGVGYSSYFALDITEPASPSLMWEFAGNAASPNLGLSTTGPAVVRVAAKVKDTDGNPTTRPDHTKNGKWFAVFASGATGTVNTVEHSLSGISEQNLRLFIVDLATGTLLKEIDTGIENAFAGTLTTGVIDTDRNFPTSDGYYSDDAVYIGYVQKDTSANTWTKGGVLRLLTRESVDPGSTDAAKQWTFSKLIDGIGPVTTSITKLQDRQNKNLWIYFGTGRYFQRNDDLSTTRQALYGVKEPCYSTATGPTNDIDNACSTTIDTNPLTTAIVDQSGDSSAPAASLGATAAGWNVMLDTSDSTFMTERVITDPIGLPNGTVFFTSFKPSTDTCQYGGNSLIWAVKYDTGGTPPAKTMQGQALMQVSTGAFAEIKLSTAFSNPGSTRYDGRRLSTPITGVPPTAQGLSLFTNPPPAKRFLHVREK